MTVTTKEIICMNKDGWPRGEWLDEPDRMEWIDPETGYPCLIKRNQFGALCGYVGVSGGHPAYGLFYDGAAAEDAAAHSDLMHQCMRKWRDSGYPSLSEWTAENPLPDRPGPHGAAGRAVSEIDVHGGLTYSGKDDHVEWAFGFDCAHAGDFSPALGSDDYINKMLRTETYRNIDYVREECRKLAAQLAAIPAAAITELPRSAIHTNIDNLVEGLKEDK